jgi:FkbM family methyltransferase
MATRRVTPARRATARAPRFGVAHTMARSLVWALSIPCRHIPQSALKERIKVATLRVQNHLPWRLQVNGGETAIQVGTPNPRTVARYSKSAGPTGRVVIVEAEPSNVERLRMALPRLPHRNVTVVHRGAWSEPGTLRLVLSPYKGDHKFPVSGIVHDNDYRPENTYDQSVEVAVDTVDNIVQAQSLARVDFVSITVNGAEIEVLKGCEKILGRRPMRIYVKAHARHATGAPISESIMAMLRSRGFTVTRSFGERAVGTHPEWTVREGDVYGYKL